MNLRFESLPQVAMAKDESYENQYLIVSYIIKMIMKPSKMNEASGNN